MSQHKLEFVLGLSLVFLTSFVHAKEIPIQTREKLDEEARKCSELKCIRQEIDGINDQILNLVARRTAYVRRAAEVKKVEDPQADRKRVEDQLSRVRQRGKALELPTGLSEDLFRLLIENSIHYQKEYKDSHKSVGFAFLSWEPRAFLKNTLLSQNYGNNLLEDQ